MFSFFKIKSVKYLLSALVVLVTVSSQADIAFQNLSEEDFKNVIKELSGNFAHTTVSGASSLGKIFGFEFGVVAALTKSPKTDALVQQADPSKKLPNVADANIIGMLSVPFGITGEIAFIPKINSSDFKFKQMGLGAKWTLTESLLEGWPVDLALKAQMTSVTLDYSQVISGPNKSDVQFTDNIWGAGVLVSKKFLFVEPYAGLTYYTGKGKLAVSGTGTIFNSTFTTAQSASTTQKTTAFSAGVEASLLFLKLGVEYANIFSTSRVAAKVAFSF